MRVCVVFGSQIRPRYTQIHAPLTPAPHPLAPRPPARPPARAPPRQANHPDEVAAGRPLPTLQLRYDVVRDALVLSTGTRGVPVAEGEEVYFRYKEKTKCGSEAFRNTYGFVPQGFAPCHPDP